MKKLPTVALGLLLLGGCTVQEFSGERKTDPVASARTRVAIAAEYIQKGEYETALRHLQQALKLEPKLPEAHNVMGVLLERDGDMLKAEDSYKRALRLNDAYSQAHNNYGVLLFKLKRYREAMQQFARAANDLAYENRESAFQNWGEAALAAGDRQQAQQAFERAVKASPRNPEPVLSLANMVFEDKDADMARDLYSRYLKLLGNTPQSSRGLWLGIRLARLDGDNNALASYELALKKLYPDSDEYRFFLQNQQTSRP